MAKIPNKKKLNYSDYTIKDSIAKYSTTIFIIFVLLILMVSVLLLRNIFIQQSLNNKNKDLSNSNISIDPKIDSYLNRLLSSENNTSEIILPSGRIDPFFE